MSSNLMQLSRILLLGFILDLNFHHPERRIEQNLVPTCAEAVPVASRYELLSSHSSNNTPKKLDQTLAILLAFNSDPKKVKVNAIHINPERLVGAHDYSDESDFDHGSRSFGHLPRKSAVVKNLVRPLVESGDVESASWSAETHSRRKWRSKHDELIDLLRTILKKKEEVLGLKHGVIETVLSDEESSEETTIHKRPFRPTKIPRPENTTTTTTKHPIKPTISRLDLEEVIERIGDKIHNKIEKLFEKLDDSSSKEDHRRHRTRPPCTPPTVSTVLSTVSTAPPTVSTVPPTEETEPPNESTLPPTEPTTGPPTIVIETTVTSTETTPLTEVTETPTEPTTSPTTEHPTTIEPTTQPPTMTTPSEQTTRTPTEPPIITTVIPTSSEQPTPSTKEPQTTESESITQPLIITTEIPTPPTVITTEITTEPTAPPIITTEMTTPPTETTTPPNTEITTLPTEPITPSAIPPTKPPTISTTKPSKSHHLHLILKALHHKLNHELVELDDSSEEEVSTTRKPSTRPPTTRPTKRPTEPPNRHDLIQEIVAAIHHKIKHLGFSEEEETITSKPSTTSPKPPISHDVHEIIERISKAIVRHKITSAGNLVREIGKIKKNIAEKLDFIDDSSEDEPSTTPMPITERTKNPPTKPSSSHDLQKLIEDIGEDIHLKIEEHLGSSGEEVTTTPEPSTTSSKSPTTKPARRPHLSSQNIHELIKSIGESIIHHKIPGKLEQKIDEIRKHIAEKFDELDDSSDEQQSPTTPINSTKRTKRPHIASRLHDLEKIVEDIGEAIHHKIKSKTKEDSKEINHSSLEQKSEEIVNSSEKTPPIPTTKALAESNSNEETNGSSPESSNEGREDSSTVEEETNSELEDSPEISESKSSEEIPHVEVAHTQKDNTYAIQLNIAKLVNKEMKRFRSLHCECREGPLVNEKCQAHSISEDVVKKAIKEKFFRKLIKAVPISDENANNITSTKEPIAAIVRGSLEQIAAEIIPNTEKLVNKTLAVKSSDDLILNGIRNFTEHSLSLPRAVEIKISNAIERISADIAHKGMENKDIVIKSALLNLVQDLLNDQESKPKSQRRTHLKSHRLAKRNEYLADTDESNVSFRLKRHHSISPLSHDDFVNNNSDCPTCSNLPEKRDASQYDLKKFPKVVCKQPETSTKRKRQPRDEVESVSWRNEKIASELSESVKIKTRDTRNLGTLNWDSKLESNYRRFELDQQEANSAMPSRLKRKENASKTGDLEEEYASYRNWWNNPQPV